LIARICLIFLFSMPTISSASVQFAQKRDIEYSQVDGLSLLMDASIPKDALRVPAAIIVHGGGWVRGDRRGEVEPLFQPLNEAGIAWFSIDYRLVSNAMQFGFGIDDVESAVRFIRSHASEFHIDPGKLALVGESAGGQLAAMAALRLPKDSVKAVVALYTPTDLVKLLKNSNYIPAQIRRSVEGTPWENLILAGLGQLSPIENVRRDMPPFLFIHGTADPLVPFSQSISMCERMREAGASCEVYPLEGAGHGIRWWESSPRYDGYKRKMTDWLLTRLSSPL
jgi:acetyl esterase